MTSPAIRIDIEQLLAYAIKAPSGHNTQPWTFTASKAEIIVAPDYARALSVVDPNHRELFISLGCAVENIVLAAQAQGLAAYVDGPSGPNDHIRITFRQAPTADPGWLALMNQRQVNRRIYNGRPITPVHLDRLRDVSYESGITARIITDASTMALLRQAVTQANRYQARSRDFRRELLRWLRFNQQEVEATGDGLSYATLGNPAIPFRPLAESIVNLVLRAGLQDRRDSKVLSSASAFMVFSAIADDKAHWLSLGRSFERFALVATEIGLSHAHHNQPLEVPAVADSLRAIPALQDIIPGLILRLGYAAPMPYSPRRPLQEMYTGGD